VAILFSDLWRVVRLGLFVFFVAVAVSFTGCDKLHSLLHPPAKTRPRPKEPASAHPPHIPAQTETARLAIILDDLGYDRAAAAAVFALPYHLTISVLPHHEYSAEIAEEAFQRGYQVMLHLPMQAQGNEKSETQELHPGMPATEISRELAGMLNGVPHVVGINNHQGSLATSDPRLMSELMPILRQRNLFFIDSRTTAATVAFDTAQKDDVPCAFRNVPFLDDVRSVAAIRKQLELAIHGAKQKGKAIAIGHPHPETLRALREMLPQAQAQGVQLVYASDLVH
jgi:uncharacterized protein